MGQSWQESHTDQFSAGLGSRIKAARSDEWRLGLENEEVASVTLTLLVRTPLQYLNQKTCVVALNQKAFAVALFSLIPFLPFAMTMTFSNNKTNKRSSWYWNCANRKSSFFLNTNIIILFHLTWNCFDWKVKNQHACLSSGFSPLPAKRLGGCAYCSATEAFHTIKWHWHLWKVNAVQQPGHCMTLPKRMVYFKHPHAVKNLWKKYLKGIDFY